MRTRPRILVFCDYYLPGYKSGGGMWTVVNLVERFHDRYDFYIVTRNFDSKGDRKVYETVQTNSWNEVGAALVFYFAKLSLSPGKAAEIVGTVDPDIVFLNSALSMPVRQFLRARRRHLIKDIPVLLAPCGEMSKGARSVKPFKKRLFLHVALRGGLYNGVIWKASFPAEGEEIRDVLGDDAVIMTAPDLTPRQILPGFNCGDKPLKRPGSVKIAFFSRIAPKKNLRYLLELLKSVRGGDVHLDIIGPIEDAAYWASCEAVIRTLPDNVHVIVAGAFSRQDDALRRLAQSHFFALPTLNENFGYVFIEALAAGCPLIISDRTAWEDIEKADVGWRPPLEEPEQFIDVLDRCLAMDQRTYQLMSERARRYATDWLNNSRMEEENARILAFALRQKHGTSAGASN